MRRAVSLVVLLFLVVVVGSIASADDVVKPKPESETKRPPLAVGNNLPGTFHPYNVTARIPSAAESEEADKEAEKTKTKKPAPTTKGGCRQIARATRVPSRIA